MEELQSALRKRKEISCAPLKTERKVLSGSYSRVGGPHQAAGGLNSPTVQCQASSGLSLSLRDKLKPQKKKKSYSCCHEHIESRTLSARVCTPPLLLHVCSTQSGAALATSIQLRPRTLQSKPACVSPPTRHSTPRHGLSHSPLAALNQPEW